MLLDLIVLFLPLIYLLGIWVTSIGNKNITPISNMPILVFVVIMALAMGCHEISEYSDRAQYLDSYMRIYDDTFQGEYKDFGWKFFVTLCTYIFSDKVLLFFIFVSFIYCFSYYFFAKKQFNKNHVGYFILLAFGSLGFSSYGIVTIRAGMAAGIALIALIVEKKYLKFILALISVSVHLSMAIPIFLYIVASRLKKDTIPYYIWLLCFVLSIVNFDLSPFLEELMFVDNRINEYTNLVTDSYKKGYRVDFLTYSIVPIIIVYRFKRKRQKFPDLYSRLYRTYLLANAAWLLVIRMAYTNRVAYLSWMIIPYIVLYPVLYKHKEKNSSKFILYLIMFIFMGINVILSIRDMLEM